MKARVPRGEKFKTGRSMQEVLTLEGASFSGWRSQWFLLSRGRFAKKSDVFTSFLVTMQKSLFAFGVKKITPKHHSVVGDLNGFFFPEVVLRRS